jgi:hypothetical protein
MKQGTIQRIFDDHFPAVDAAQQLDQRARTAAWDIRTCRTPLQGYHVDVCPKGHYSIVLNNSCGHRSCPLCGATETQLWIERQLAKEIGCEHYQVVFTSSDSLRPLWRWNRKLFTNLYFRAAWHSLRELLANVKHLGALPGVIAVFQSWNDELGEHLHLHFIVTCGGINPNGKWVAANAQFPVCAEALMRKFRGKFLAYLREAFSTRTRTGKVKTQVLQPPRGRSVQQCLNLFNKLGRQPWHVQVDTAMPYANGAIKYVGHYIRRGPISERRILSYNGNQVVIAYAHPEKHESASFTLDARTFVLRVLSHVPQRGTHCVRAYGLYHSACREQLNQARAYHSQPAYRPESEPPDKHELIHRMFPDFTADLCPKCHARLITVTVVRPRQNSPPLKRAA